MKIKTYSFHYLYVQWSGSKKKNKNKKIEREKRMPGIIGPADYSREPTRHPLLKINAKVH